MNLQRVVVRFSIAAAALLFVGQASVEAQHPGCFGLNGQYGQGYGIQNRTYPRVPYFAAHPPVYYQNRIVRRPYGVSPFAAPPGVKPVEFSIPVEPVVIKNPYVVPQESATPEESIAPQELPIDANEKNKKKRKGKKSVLKRASQANVVIPNKFYKKSFEPNRLVNVQK